LKKLTILLLFFTFFHFTNAQSFALEKKAYQLRSQGKFKDALVVFRLLLQLDSANANYLNCVAMLTCKTLHDANSSGNAPIAQYNHCKYLAEKALKLDTNNAESHYALAFSIGVLNEFATKKQQINNAGIMKREIDKCIKLNPKYGAAYHLLGRWYGRLAEFNSVEKLAVKIIYGATLPEATYKAAAEAYEKSILYQPEYILNQYELALIYHKMGKNADAKVWLNHAINSTYSGDDAMQVKASCRKLIGELN